MPASPVAVARPSRRPLLAVAAAVLVLGAVASAVALRSGDDAPDPSTAGESTSGGAAPTPVAPALSGGTVAVGPVDEAHGTVHLSVPDGTRMVGIVSSMSDAEYRWNGKQALTLEGLEAGRWRTKVQPAEGKTLRATLDVLANTSCTYVFNDEEWTSQGCE
jgi:hypothetical protein